MIGALPQSRLFVARGRNRPCRWFAALLFVWSAALAAATPRLHLSVDLDPATRRFSAVAALESDSRDFRFELHESLAVTRATADGKDATVIQEGREGPYRAWRVTTPARAALRIEYGGILPALDRQLDHRGVLRGMPPMASAEGSFLPDGAAWYPRPSRFFSYRVDLSLPADQRGLVAGRLLAEDAAPGQRYRASLGFEHPADGIDLMAGPYVVREKVAERPGESPLRLRTYFFPGMEGLAEGYLEDSARYLRRYSDEIGPYPYTEFSIVASPLPTGFGMPTLTYLGAEVLRLPFIRATSLGHEVLHNWWGNGVHPDYAKGNWSEGLTTFMADYAYKEAESDTAAREMRLSWLRDFAALPESDRQTLAGFRSRAHGAAAAVGYGKSAMLFVMLKDLLGPEAFRAGIRRFWSERRFRVASWDDLRSDFEHASGRQLGRFFDQWLNRAGGPRVGIVDAVRTTKGLRLVVEQAEPAYAMTLPIHVAAGAESEVISATVSKAREEVVLPLRGQVGGVRLDPDLRVWRRLDQDQLPPILRQWIVAPAPRLLVAAGTVDATEAARALARKVLEVPPSESDPGDARGGPLLIVGLHPHVDAVLGRLGLPPRPGPLAGRGSAQVWTVWREAGADSAGGPVAVVSAANASALRDLMRPLPHYGAQSWLVFEGSRAIDKGVWPAPGRLVPVRPSGE
ncbi:MAG TPA: M1 family aminopeptidase [Rhodocyclaceae bacterium]|nr:M1 family aminopeptidase [Rhodocyclaceae bacterium]